MFLRNLHSGVSPELLGSNSVVTREFLELPFSTKYAPFVYHHTLPLPILLL